MRRQDRLKLDTSLFLCRSTALLSLGDGRRSLAPNPTLLTCAPYALERADARAPTLLACAPSALVWALCGFLLGDTVAWLRCSFRASAGRCSPHRTPCMCSFCAGAGTLRIPSWGHRCLAPLPPLPRHAAASSPPRRPPLNWLACVACSPQHRSFSTLRCVLRLYC